MAIRSMEMFLSQWDKMQSIQMEMLRYEDKPVFVVWLNVLPSQEVQLSDIMAYDPTMTFRGKNQIVIIPREPITDHAVVLFESNTDSAIELRFDGIIYGLIRLLAFPLEDCQLREIRVYSKTSSSAKQLIHVALFMQAKKQQSDYRRMLIFQEWKKKTIERKAFTTLTQTEKKKHSFHYIKPNRRYTYP